jgi:hypothetical protein
LDNASLLASREVSDNVIGLLGRPPGAAALRKVIGRIARMGTDRQILYLRSLFAVAVLGGWEDVLEREAKSVPVIIDIMGSKVLGRERRKGLEKGHLRGERTLLRRVLEKKFGPIPTWVNERLSKATVPEIEDLAVRLLDARSLDELMAR